MPSYPTGSPNQYSHKSVAQWAEKERHRLKNIENECKAILDGRDNTALLLKVEINGLKEENRALTAKVKKQQKRIDWLEARYIYGETA